MLKILEVNESRICCFTDPGVYTGEYYKYCVDLLVQVLQNSEPINIIFGNIDNFHFGNKNRNFRLDVQSEHTLVKLGGRSVDEIVYGDIDLLDGTGKYLIRIPNYKYYVSLDGTIEYSVPNIANISTNTQFDDYLKKAIYVAPTIYDSGDFSVGARVKTITMFSSNQSNRRSDFSSRATQEKLDIVNVQGVFHKDHLQNIYKDTKIMVNIHQTDHHHTFEELRVLPALLNGVIVVSEEVPLKEKIPYGDFIIWASYEDIPRVVKDVQANYDHYYKEIFMDELRELLIALHQTNIKRLTRKLFA